MTIRIEGGQAKTRRMKPRSLEKRGLNKIEKGETMGNNMINKLVIEKDETLEVKVYDGDGEVHDITAAFRSIAGTTSPVGFTNTIILQAANTNIEIGFTATDKEMIFGLDPSVVKQLVALAEVRLAGGSISVVSEHLCELGQETEECFNAEPETLVLDTATFNAQAKPITIEGEVTSIDLGTVWVDTGYLEIGIRPNGTKNDRNAGIFLVALNQLASTGVHLQDYSGGGRSGGVIEIPKNSPFRYKITLTPSGSIGGVATLEVWVDGISQGEVSLNYGYSSTWEENVPGPLDEDFTVARLFYSIVADRRGIGGLTYNAEVGDVVVALAEE